MNIIALGGVNLDILGQSDAAFAFGDSNPGRVRFRAGGVVHNIAAELVRLGHRVFLVSSLGSDHASVTVRAMCTAEGINTDLCIPGNSGPGVYLCLHGPDGDMIAAVNDMRGMESLRPEGLAELTPAALAALEEREPEPAGECRIVEDTVWYYAACLRAGDCPETGPVRLRFAGFPRAVPARLLEVREEAGQRLLLFRLTEGGAYLKIRFIEAEIERG